MTPQREADRVDRVGKDKRSQREVIGLARDFVEFGGRRVGAAILLMIVGGLLESVSLALLAPLFALFTDPHRDGLANRMFNLVLPPNASMSSKLGLVLLLFVIVMIVRTLVDHDARPDECPAADGLWRASPGPDDGRAGRSSLARHREYEARADHPGARREPRPGDDREHADASGGGAADDADRAMVHGPPARAGGGIDLRRDRSGRCISADSRTQEGLPSSAGK